MQTTKMSLANIQGKLSRTEMKSIMAGSGGGDNCPTNCTTDCTGLCKCHHGGTSNAYCANG